MKRKAYIYGVMLGDGFYGYRNAKDDNMPDYVMLKATDREFVEKFSDELFEITGRKYSVHMRKPEKENHRPLWVCKCYAPELVKESLDITKGRTILPNFVIDGDKEIKISFIQGLMDSEGYITVQINPLKMTHIGLYFANTSAWTKDLWHLFQNLGIKVSKLYVRKMKDGRKDCYWFKIDFHDYVTVGLTFNIERKKSRLEFASRILRDYMRSYKGYQYDDPVEDIVQLQVKACG